MISFAEVVSKLNINFPRSFVYKIAPNSIEHAMSNIAIVPTRTNITFLPTKIPIVKES